MPRIPMERSGEMEVFARVVEKGGFSAAARSLDLTPSAVSKLIARLEDRLGARLLMRTTRALTLTEEGEAYHRAALGVLRDLDDADRAAGGGGGWGGPLGSVSSSLVLTTRIGRRRPAPCAAACASMLRCRSG
jgi:DNA-binding transcriptional LysR family regulator